MLLLLILGYILLGIGVLLTAIIFIPYNYSFSGGNLEQLQFKGSVSWLFGGIKMSFCQHSKQNVETIFTIIGFNKKVKLRPKSPKANTKKDTKLFKNRKASQSKKHFAFIKYINRDIIENAISSLLKILKYCQPRTLSVYTRIGFNDPMYTGLLCAINSQFSVLLNRYDFNIQPVFNEEIIEGRFLIGGQVWLPYLILVMIGFLITKPIRSILISQLKTKIKGGLQYVR